MKNLKFIFLTLLSVATLSSCLKNDIQDDYDYEAEAKRIDSVYKAQKPILAAYAAEKLGPEAIYNDSTQMWYKILAPATDNSYEYTINNGYFVTPRATVKYKGEFLDGTVFDEPSLQQIFTLNSNSIISAWLYAFYPKTVVYNGQTYHTGLVPNGLKKGHKIIFVAPSPICYDKAGKKGGTKDIPANTPLVFTVEVINIENAPY